MSAIKQIIILVYLGVGAGAANSQSTQPIKDTLPIKMDSLKAAIVKATMRPRMKGDTIEYNTKGIKMRPNAVAEELLARLPGLQIDDKGNITYNGEKIAKLLVDGEDFFGYDPAIITRNFDADRIDKIQILDRKSEHTLFTGVDDGIRIKTLNIVLKEESKHGYFGKVSGEANTQGMYNVNGLLTDLQNHEQVAALGFASNAGITDFSSSTAGGSEDLGAQTANGDPLGTSAGAGIPRSIGLASHYANTWTSSTDHLVSNPQYSNIFTQPVTTLLSLQSLPDSVYRQYQLSKSTNKITHYWVNLIYDKTFNSKSAISVWSHISSTMSQNEFRDSASSAFNGVNVNKSVSIVKDNTSQANIGSGVSYRLSARHNPERVFSINLEWSSINGITNGYVYSVSRYYQPNGLPQSLDTTDQRKQIINHSTSLNSTINISEPLWPKTYLALTLGMAFIGSSALQGTYDRDGGKYDLYVDTLSSYYRGKNTTQQAIIDLVGTHNRLNYTLSSGIQKYGYEQHNLQEDSNSQYHYVNFTSQLRVDFTPHTQTKYVLEYEGATQQPSITQLEPLVNNTNPLLITVGNPNLRPGYNQTLKLKFDWFKTWIYNASFNVGMASKSISTKTTIDSLGRQVSQPVNVNGGENASVDFHIYRKWQGLSLDLYTSVNFSKSANYVNADLNQTNTYTENEGLSLGYYNPESFSFQISAQIGYFATRSSINVNAPLHYWTQSHSATFNLFSIPGIEFHTNLKYNWQEGATTFVGGSSVLLWNAYMLHNFLKNRLVAKLKIDNICNTNAGITRFSNGNFNSQSDSNILGRYWMFSVAFHFDHPSKTKAN